MALTPRCAQCLETISIMQPPQPRQVCRLVARIAGASPRRDKWGHAGWTRSPLVLLQARPRTTEPHDLRTLPRSISRSAASTEPISLPSADRTSIRTSGDVRCRNGCLAPSSSLLLEWTSCLLASVLPPSPRRSHLFAFRPLPLASPFFHFFRHRFCLSRGRSQHSLFRCALLPFFCLVTAQPCIPSHSTGSSQACVSAQPLPTPICPTNSTISSAVTFGSGDRLEIGEPSEFKNVSRPLCLFCNPLQRSQALSSSCQLDTPPRLPRI